MNILDSGIRNELNIKSNRHKINEWIKWIEPVQMRMSNDCAIEQIFFSFNFVKFINNNNK